MADRDRFGGSDRDYAYTDYSGRRGLDVRNPGDHAIQRAHNYPSNRQPLLNQPPMEGPPQRPHVNPRMRHINPRGMGGGLGALQQKSQLRRPENFTNLDMLGRPDLSFRYSHMSPNEGMGLGGRLDKAILANPKTGYPVNMIRGTWRRMEDARRFEDLDEYGYLEGVPRQRTTFTEGFMLPHHFNEMYGGVYDDAIFRTVDPNTDRIEQYPQAGNDTGIGSTNEYQQMAEALDPNVALDILGDPNRNMDSVLQIYGDDSWDNLPAFKIGDKWYGNPALGMPGKMGSGWTT